MYTSAGELNREYAIKAASLGLNCQVLGDGNIAADICVIAEAPGHREVELRTPLVGASGQLLWSNLAPFGIRRQHCYITNVVKTPLVEVKGKRTISKHELAHWEAMLKWELSQLPNVKYIMLLGDAALHAVTGESGIEKWRGSVLLGEPTVICTYNPANILRKPMLEPVFRLDCAKLDMVRRDKWTPHHINALYDPSPREAIEWCDKMIQENAPVAFDIETIGGETACVGFANDPHVGMCINFRDRSSNRWTTTDEARVRYAIQRVLRHSKVRLVAQNGGFDCGWLWFKDRIKAKPIWLDTMLAHHCLHPTWPHNLGFLTAQYTTHPFYKDDISEWREGGNISTFWEYNVKDICITHAVGTALHRELESQGLADLFFNHIMRLQPYLIQATVLGNKIDQEMKDALAVEYLKQVDALREDFVQAAREAANDDTLDVNPLSPKQLGALFFQRLRLVGKTLSTDENNRNAIIDNPRTSDAARKMLLVLNDYKEQHKLLTTYINSSTDDDGRMRSDYSQIGVASAPGRLSSKQTLWGSGMNLQNQPDILRGMFIADRVIIDMRNGEIVGVVDNRNAVATPAHYIKEEDLCYVYFDGAQAEARIVGWDYGIQSWMHQFEQARLHPGTFDAHRALASEMFKVPYDDVPTYDFDTESRPTIRYTAKRCRHGLNYRMMPPRLATVLRISVAEATTLWHAYHRTTPELQQGWARVIEEVTRERKLYNFYGRRIEFLGSRLDEKLMDVVIAFRPQSTLGDHITRVQWQAPSDKMWPRDARIPFNNHDSLTALCRHRDATLVGSILKKYAEAPIMIRGNPLIIPCDVKVSVPDERGVHRWSNMKKLDV